jgi:hypothetical protein
MSLFPSFKFFDFFFDVLDAFDDGTQLITHNLDRSTHGLLLPNMIDPN